MADDGLVTLADVRKSLLRADVRPDVVVFVLDTAGTAGERDQLFGGAGPVGVVAQTGRASGAGVERAKADIAVADVAIGGTVEQP